MVTSRRQTVVVDATIRDGDAGRLGKHQPLYVEGGACHLKKC